MSSVTTEPQNGDGETAENEKKPFSEAVRAIGGLIAVAIGVVAVAAIAVVALNEKSNTAATIAGSASGVIGSIVGAYFGVKIGSDGTKDAIQATKTESAKKDKQSAKAQVYALHVSPGQAAEVEAAAVAAAQAAAEPAA